MRRTPLLFFVIAALFAVAALNEGNLNHWGTTIILGRARNRRRGGLDAPVARP